MSLKYEPSSERAGELVSTAIQHLAPFVILHVFADIADIADAAGDASLDVRAEDKVVPTALLHYQPGRFASVNLP